MRLESGLRPGTGWLSASQPAGRGLRGKAEGEGRDSAGRGGWVSAGRRERGGKESEGRGKK